ncbi:hypothetical protein [Magnetofaba australis]|uniref:Uncharacterized protein n=1 Tax=Magnetofaba australis IT-1 TaxID=1434232 RepID=A0A1Y2K066_9PROT|nr:hypothetical protein [Magnetofaba australis]OSM00133.1 hypothetical protein MAIT1_00567 [Magnetofaba australis IT-1]
MSDQHLENTLGQMSPELGKELQGLEALQNKMSQHSQSQDAAIQAMQQLQSGGDPGATVAQMGGAPEMSSGGLIGDMDGVGLSAALFFSIVGIAWFRYGKNAPSMLALICGVALMLYSYWVQDTVWIVVVGLGLSFLPFLTARGSSSRF